MKKSYIHPRLEVVALPASRVLVSSPDDDLDMFWSADNAGTVGPEQIDDYSTIDSF